MCGPVAQVDASALGQEDGEVPSKLFGDPPLKEAQEFPETFVRAHRSAVEGRLSVDGEANGAGHASDDALNPYQQTL